MNNAWVKYHVPKWPKTKIILTFFSGNKESKTEILQLIFYEEDFATVELPVVKWSLLLLQRSSEEIIKTIMWKTNLIKNVLMQFDSDRILDTRYQQHVPTY